jgi:hypothetical protein
MKIIIYLNDMKKILTLFAFTISLNAMAQNEKKPTPVTPPTEKKEEKDKTEQKVLVTKDGKVLTHKGKILVINKSKEKEKESKDKGKREENE